MTANGNEIDIAQENWTPPQQKVKYEKVDSGGGGALVGVGFCFFVATFIIPALVLFFWGWTMWLLLVPALPLSAFSIAEMGGRRIEKMVLRRHDSP